MKSACTANLNFDGPTKHTSKSIITSTWEGVFAEQYYVLSTLKTREIPDKIPAKARVFPKPPSKVYLPLRLSLIPSSTSLSFPPTFLRIGDVLPPLDSFEPDRRIILDGAEDNAYGM